MMTKTRAHVIRPSCSAYLIFGGFVVIELLAFSPVLLSHPRARRMILNFDMLVHCINSPSYLFRFMVMLDL